MVIDSREVARLADVRGTPLTMDDAAAHLGVGRDMVGALAEAGLIQVARLRVGDGTVATIYRADFLDLSLGDLLRRLPVRSFPEDAGAHALCLRGVQALLREQGGRLPELLRVVRDGVLPAFRATGDSLDLTDLWWERSDIVRHLRIRLPGQDAARLGEREVALLLGVTRRVLCRWRDAELLQPVTEMKSEGETRGGQATECVYDRGAVNAFRAHYATLAEAAALVGVATQTLQRWADRRQVPGTRVHNVPYHDGILYDRCAIEEFKATRVTAEESGALLGILPRTFNKWVRAGRIVPVTRDRPGPPVRPGGSAWHAGNANSAFGSLSDERVAASEAARYLRMTHRNFNRLVAQGKIRAVVADAQMCPLYAKDDVIRLARVRGLTVDAASVG